MIYKFNDHECLKVIMAGMVVLISKNVLYISIARKVVWQECSYGGYILYIYIKH